MVVDAVWSELVSLVFRENTGNFPNFGPYFDQRSVYAPRKLGFV